LIDLLDILAWDGLFLGTLAHIVANAIGSRLSSSVEPTDLYKVPDVIPSIHAESYHVATDKVHSIDGGSSGLFLATIYNQSQLARSTLLVDQHCGNGCSITRAPPPLVITTKLAAAILVVPLFGGGALPAQYYPCG